MSVEYNHTLLKELCYKSLQVGCALGLIKTLGRPKSYAMRLQNWPSDCAVYICDKTKDRLVWLDDQYSGDPEIRGAELLSADWEVWRVVK